jgi:hypoxanthine phosphoribosyltransferase
LKAVVTLDEVRDVRRRARCLYTASEVQQAIAAMAREITARLSERDPIVVAVMQGGAFTAVELCKHFDFAYRFDYLHATRYGAELAGGALGWRVRPNTELAGGTVLLVDDVLDRGMTLAAAQRELTRGGVSALYTAVLVAKDVPRRGAPPTVDFVGLHIGDCYVFGAGMDYKGYWRGLPGLYGVDSV